MSPHKKLGYKGRWRPNEYILMEAQSWRPHVMNGVYCWKANSEVKVAIAKL